MEEQNTTITKPLGILKSTILCLKMMVMPKHIIESEEFTRIDGRARYIPAILSIILLLLNDDQSVFFNFSQRIAAVILLFLEPLIFILRKYVIKGVLKTDLKQANEINRPFSFIKLLFNAVTNLEALVIIPMVDFDKMYRNYMFLALFFIISLIPYVYFVKIVRLKNVKKTGNAIQASIPLYFALNFFRIFLMLAIVMVLIGFVLIVSD